MSKPNRSRLPEGVEQYCRKSCRDPKGRRCNCTPSFRAKVTDPDGKRHTSPRFSSLAAAKNWRTDTLAQLNRGTCVAPPSTTFREAAADFLDGVKVGRTLNRNGRPYKPSVVRDYEADLRRHVLDELGDKRLCDVRRGDLMALIENMVEDGLAPSTIRNALDPVRRIFRRAVQREMIPISPCQELELPRGTGKRDCVASPREAAQLVAALPEEKRAQWATGLYAGLRMGELRGLRCCDVDLTANVLADAGLPSSAPAAGRPVPIPTSKSRPLACWNSRPQHRPTAGRSSRSIRWDRSASRYARTPARDLPPPPRHPLRLRRTMIASASVCVLAGAVATTSRS